MSEEKDQVNGQMPEEETEGQQTPKDEQDQSAQEVDEVEELKAQLQEEKDKFLRLYAEFENFRRRTARERMELVQTAGEELMVALLPVLDDFDRGLVQVAEAKDVESVRSGLELIHSKLKSTLQQKGLKEMNAIGETFNPEFHEAITEIPAEKKKQKGKVMDQVEKGYYLHEKIIRYPKVVVGK